MFRLLLFDNHNLAPNNPYKLLDNHVCKRVKKRTIILAYHTNVSNALKNIVTRKSKEVDGTIDLSGYIEKLEKLSNAILNLNIDIKK